MHTMTRLTKDGSCKICVAKQLVKPKTFKCDKDCVCYMYISN